MTDDHVIDIRRYLDSSPAPPDLRAFAVWGGTGTRARLALPVWRSIQTAGGDWGGVVSYTQGHPEPKAELLFALDLKENPARTTGFPDALHLVQGREVPFLFFGKDEGLAVFLGEENERYWFLQVLGVTSDAEPEGRERETLLFLAGECAGLLFFRELATLLPSSSSTP